MNEHPDKTEKVVTDAAAAIGKLLDISDELPTNAHIREVLAKFYPSPLPAPVGSEELNKALETIRIAIELRYGFYDRRIQAIQVIQNALTQSLTDLARVTEDREALAKGICPDGSITETKELVDHCLDLQDAFTKLGDLDRVQRERDGQQDVANAFKGVIDQMLDALKADQLGNKLNAVTVAKMRMDALEEAVSNTLAHDRDERRKVLEWLAAELLDECKKSGRGDVMKHSLKVEGVIAWLRHMASEPQPDSTGKAGQ